MEENKTPEGVFPTELNKIQRRVLGVLSEKAFTTPEYYPLTLKAVMTGCNQKSNRMPHISYSEEQLEEVLDQLREMKLILVVHTAGGRTERYRHQIRHCLNATEPQLAILTELLLRGRQQLGELRSRANRMASIENAAVLREELQGLVAIGLVQASGDLSRRGIEVDHTLYREREGMTMEGQKPENGLTSGSPELVESVSEVEPLGAGVGTISEGLLEEIRLENRELRETVEQLQGEVREISAIVETLRRDLGY